MENQRFIYAQTMEYAIVETMNQCNNIQELKPILDLLLDFEKKFISMLQEAYNSYPEIQNYMLNINELITEKLWTEIMNDFSSNHATTAEIRKITTLWTIYTLIEKSSQFYRQTSANSAYPSEKLFFSSLAEIKNVIKRRVEKIIRISNNKIWSELGFAPFVLGRK